MNKKMKIGIVGCGNILDQYVHWCRKFDILQIWACSDIVIKKAEKAASDYGIAHVYTYAEMLEDAEIDIVVNLTVPNAHAEVSQLAIASGKNIYSEKPLATSRKDALKIIREAKTTGLRVGCAPDTFLGGSLQTCRKIIDDGWIGEPIGASAFMMRYGPEGWHPNPAFFYQSGAGPLFDMAPYYLTALILLLGPIERVTGATRISFSERIATSEANFGQRLPVSVPTHTTALLNFTSGPIGVLITTFDVRASELPHIEIYGSDGTLSVPDPNNFGGSVRVRRTGDKAWLEFPLTHSDDVGRGIGVADMAYGLAYGRPHRANGEMAYHVVEVMDAVEESSQRGQHVHIESSCERPMPLPMGLLPGQLDE